jgi:hypothetical protein
LSNSVKKLLSFTNFNKGINTTSSFDELDPTELVTGINIDLKARGGYTQRKGCSIYKTIELNEEVVEHPVAKLIDYPGSPLLVIDKSLRDLDNDVITLLLNSNSIDYEFFTNSKLYLLDGTEYWVYDGTTCAPVTPAEGADLTPIKRCTRLLQRGQRMFALGDPQNPNYLYFSEMGDPANFKASSIVKAVTDDNDTLMGLCLFADSLLAFKKDEVFRWSGWDPSSDVEFKPLDTGHGTVAPDSVVVTEDFLIFADDDGVFCLTTIETDLIKSHNISRNIKEIWKTLTNRDKMKAIVYDGNYYLACCDDGTGVNNMILKASLGMVYNGSVNEGISSLLFPWVVYRGWNVSDWLIIGEDLYFGSSVNGTVYKAFDTLNDSGVAVYSEATHYLKLEDAVTRKKLKRLFLIALQDEEHRSTVRLDIDAGYASYHKLVSLDESGSWDVGNWGEVVWDWVDTVIKEIRIGKKLTRIRLKISHEAVDEVMTIYGFAAFYKTKKPRGSRNGVTNIDED